MESKKDELQEKTRLKINCEASLKKPPGGWGRDVVSKMASVSKQVLINANNENDYGFDIHPNNRYSPYKCINCRYAGNDLKNYNVLKLNI